MKTDDLRVNQLSDDAYHWYLGYLTALDAKDIEGYGAYLAPDVELIMNNADPVRGRDDVKQGLAQYWQSFGTIEHDLLNIYGLDHSFCLEALNHYTTAAGDHVTLRAVAFTDRDDAGAVTSVRLYTDTAPLFDLDSATPS